MIRNQWYIVPESHLRVGENLFQADHPIIDYGKSREKLIEKPGVEN
jgi:hypothetical protein